MNIQFGWEGLREKWLMMVEGHAAIPKWLRCDAHRADWRDSFCKGVLSSTRQWIIRNRFNAINWFWMVNAFCWCTIPPESSLRWPVRWMPWAMMMMSTASKCILTAKHGYFYWFKIECLRMLSGKNINDSNHFQWNHDWCKWVRNESSLSRIQSFGMWLNYPPALDKFRNHKKFILEIPIWRTNRFSTWPPTVDILTLIIEISPNLKNSSKVNRIQSMRPILKRRTRWMCLLRNDGKT